MPSFETTIDAAFYRRHAARARRLAPGLPENTRRQLESLALEYDEVAEDMEAGGIEIRHPELAPRRAA